MSTAPSFMERHDFLIRRLHSLSGLVPVGAFMCVHLLTNASIMAGAQTYQNAVFQIHSLGPALVPVEWAFIFLPILFHGVVGMIIIRGGSVNGYNTSGNLRYTLQRLTGMIAFAFILWHVLHMHGWFHHEAWLANVARPLGGGNFFAYNASSTAGMAMQQHILVPILYLVGVLACVFHLANGIWTMGITWGLWTSPAAQNRANYVAIGVGAVLTIFTVTSIIGFYRVDVSGARALENRMYEASVESGRIAADEHKRWHDTSVTEGHNEEEPAKPTGVAPVEDGGDVDGSVADAEPAPGPEAADGEEAPSPGDLPVRGLPPGELPPPPPATPPTTTIPPVKPVPVISPDLKPEAKPEQPEE